MHGQKQLENIRLKNLNSILAVFRKYGAVSATCVSNETGISITTVKKCIEDGIETKMIKEDKIASSTGGRKAQLYKIQSNFQTYVSFLLNNDTLITRVYNFSLNNCFTDEKKINITKIDVETISQIRNIEKQFGKISVVTFSLPCIVNDGTIVTWYRNKNFEGFSLKKHIEKSCKAIVFVENDMKLCAETAIKYIEGQNPTIATIRFDVNSIGVGEVVHGRVHRGFSGFAGEIGYLTDCLKNVSSIAYTSKIVRSIIVVLNPQAIIFYNDNKKINPEKILQNVAKSVPEYAVPKIVIAENYYDDIFEGMINFINSNWHKCQ